jgi:hypothetical protein
MKTFKHAKIAMMVIAGAIMLGFGHGLLAAVPMSGGTASEPISQGGITPYVISGDNQGGNRTCDEVGKAYFNNALYYQCRSNKVNYTDGNFEGTFSDITTSNPDCDRNNISVTTDGTYVSFIANPDGIGAAIVKGSNEANTYVYDPQRISDSGLASPVNASGHPSGLSNLTFCWNPVNQGGDECFTDETAWAAGTRYVSKGNWATYTEYAAGKSVTLYAGQTYVAGTVSFSAPANGVVTITITLNDGFRFALNPTEVDGVYKNNVKVQDYATIPPAVNPAPGLFYWHQVATASPTTIEVPLNKFYGVHVDIERKIPCPDPK